jgi:hypothetical protein
MRSCPASPLRRPRPAAAQATRQGWPQRRSLQAAPGQPPRRPPARGGPRGVHFRPPQASCRAGHPPGVAPEAFTSGRPRPAAAQASRQGWPQRRSLQAAAQASRRAGHPQGVALLYTPRSPPAIAPVGPLCERIVYSRGTPCGYPVAGCPLRVSLAGTLSRAVPCGCPLQVPCRGLSLAGVPCGCPLRVSLAGVPCGCPLRVPLAGVPCGCPLRLPWHGVAVDGCGGYPLRLDSRFHAP